MSFTRFAERSPFPASEEKTAPSERDPLPLRVPVMVFLLAFVTLAALGGYLGGLTPATYAMSASALPVGALLAVAVLWTRGRRKDLSRFTAHLATGALWGFLGLVAYDLYQPLVKWVTGATFETYRAMPVFGRILTGLPSTALGAILLGWAFHFWMGVMAGMIFVLLRPRGGLLAGLVFAMVLQTARLLAYPSRLPATLHDSDFLSLGIIGFSLWGAVLGAGIRRWGFGRD